MNRTNFIYEMERLHRGFGIAEGNRIAIKIAEWFELWDKSKSHDSGEMISKIVTLAIGEHERMPSFAQLMGLRDRIFRSLPHISYPTTPCRWCSGEGIVKAAKWEMGQKAIFSFRCSYCENWRGKYEGIPVWNPKLSSEGYEFENLVVWDPEDAEQIKGLIMLRNATPNLYDKIQIPENIREAVKKLEATGWKPSGFKDMPGIKTVDPEEKERIREESLRAEREMEGIPF